MSYGYGYGLHQQQTTKIHMTPQLRQAIRILQLSTPELMELVREEFQDNPILELPENASDCYSLSRGIGSNTGIHATGDHLSLETHLKQQLSFTENNIPHSLKRIIVYMIGNLDGNGYLELSLGQIADSLQLDLDEAEKALSILQGFDPAGVAARNLKECLLLQANKLPNCPPLLTVLISNHLEDVANYRIPKLAKALAVSEQEIKDAIKRIKCFNPRPGAAFQSSEIRYIVPDVIIRRAGERFVVSIQDAALPRLTINANYEQMAKVDECAAEASHFIREKMNSAVFLLKCLEQRRLTLLRVAQAIVEEQAEFFRRGVAYLKPMVLRQIADKLSIHESTVSRATSGKYAQTPWGVFELTFFFPSGFNIDGQASASSERVKERIREWVSIEDKSSPLSDQKLADNLLAEGIEISRRTVAKYREQLGIGSSVKRKEV